MSDINQLVLEEYIVERAFKNQRYMRTRKAALGMAQAGKIRQLAKGSALQKQISVARARLNKLLERQRQTYSARARMSALRG